MELNLEGKTVLITGASRGIGAAIANSFAREGCNLRLVGRDAKALENLCAELRELYGIDASAFSVDLRDTFNLRNLANANSDVDILVNNAGDVPNPRALDAIDEDLIEAELSLKVQGYVNLTRHFYGHMKTRRKGVIINNIGVAGELPNDSQIIASLCNAALTAFTKAIGKKSLLDKIRVVGISPGHVNTDRYKVIRNASWEKLYGIKPGSLPVAHFSPPLVSQPQEIADIIVFAASDRCPSLSGSIITVDRGAGSM